jgi:Flp pilus assembly protein TadD
MQGKHEKAVDTIKPVTKADKNNATAWKLLGMAAQKLNRLQTMCTAYGELLRLQPNGRDAEQARGNRKTANCK